MATFPPSFDPSKFFKSLPPPVQQAMKPKPEPKPSPKKKTSKKTIPITYPPPSKFIEQLTKFLPPTVKAPSQPSIDWDEIKSSEPPPSGTVQKSPDVEPVIPDTDTRPVTAFQARNIIREEQGLPPIRTEPKFPDAVIPSVDTKVTTPVDTTPKDTTPQFQVIPGITTVSEIAGEALGYTDRPSITAPPMGAGGYDYGTVDPSDIKPKFVTTPPEDTTSPYSSESFWKREREVAMTPEEVSEKELQKRLFKLHTIGYDPETGKPINVRESEYQVKFGYKPNDPDYYTAKDDINSKIANTENVLDDLNKFVPMAERNLLQLKSEYENVAVADKGSMFEIDLNNDGIIDPDTEIKNRDFVLDYLQEQMRTNQKVADLKSEIPKYEGQVGDLENLKGIIEGYERLGYEMDITKEGGYEFEPPSSKEVFEWRFGDLSSIAYQTQALMQSPLAIESLADIIGGGWEGQKEQLAEQGLGQLFTLEQYGIGKYAGQVATSPAMVEGVLIPLSTAGLGYGVTGIGAKIGGKLTGIGGKFTSGITKLTPTGQKIVGGTLSLGKVATKPLITAGKLVGGTRLGRIGLTGATFGVIEAPGIIEQYETDPSQVFGYVARRGFGWGMAIGGFKAGAKLYKPPTTTFKPGTGTQPLFTEDKGFFTQKYESFMETGRMAKMYSAEIGKHQVGFGERVKSMFSGTQPGYTPGKMFPSTWKPMATGRESITTWEQLRGQRIDPFAPRFPTAETAWGYDPYVTSSVYDPTFGQKYAISKYTGRLGGKKYVLTSEDFLSGKKGKLIPQIDEKQIGTKSFMEGDRPSVLGRETYGRFAFDKGVKYDEPFWFYKDTQPRTVIPQIDEKKIGTKYFMEGDRPATVGRDIYGKYAFDRTPTTYEPFWFYKDQAPGRLIPMIDEKQIGTKFFMEGDRPARVGRDIYGRYAFTGKLTDTTRGVDFISAPVGFKSTPFKFTEKPTGIKPVPLTETIKKAPTKVTTPPTKDITKFEWYRSPIRDVKYVKGTGGFGGVPDAYSMAYGRIPLEYLEFLEEGVTDVSPYWGGKAPGVTKAPGTTRVGGITGTTSIVEGVTGQIGGTKGELGEISIGGLISKPKIETGVKGKLWEGTDRITTPKIDVGVGSITAQAFRTDQKLKLGQQQALMTKLFKPSVSVYKTLQVKPTKPRARPTQPRLPKVTTPGLFYPGATDTPPKKRKRVRKRKTGLAISDTDIFDKGLLSDIVSVTKTQARYGVATHPKLTEELWKRGEQTLFARVPTVELLKEEKKGKKKKGKGEKIVLY